MKDRIPTYPGRVQLTPVPGQANLYDMVRADEPAEPGSIYSRGNVLPDDVCDLMGLDRAAAEPKDAFRRLANNSGIVNVPVQTGQTITAGDIVDVVNGYASKVSKNLVVGETVSVYSYAGGAISAAELDESHVFLVYGNGGTIEARVATISGDIVSTGNAYIVSSYATNYISVTKLSSTKVVISYSENNSNGRSIVATVSGTVISFGSAYTIVASNITQIGSAALSGTTFAVAYNQGSNATLKIGTVSGANITFGNAYVYSSSLAALYTSIAVLTPTTIVICYSDGSTYYGRAIVGTVSGTTVAFGSVAIFNSATTYYTSTAMLTSDTVVIAYRNVSDNYGKVLIGTVSGTTITFGTKYNFYTSAVGSGIHVSGISSSRFMIAFSTTSSGVRVKMCSVSGAVISFGAEITVISDNAAYDGVSVVLSENNYAVFKRSNSENSYLASVGYNPTEAIALSDGTSGEGVLVIFDGNAVAAGGFAKGDTIKSTGVTAYCPYDGLLCVTGYWKNQN